MKTTQLLFAGILGLSSLLMSGQVTQPTNAVSSAASYVGTSNNFDVIFKRQAVAAGLLATNKVALGINSAAGTNGTAIGVSAGQFASGGPGYSTYVGYYAGRGQSVGVPNTGDLNVGIGYVSLFNNTSGNHNICVGGYAGYSNTTGWVNTFIGTNAGVNNTTGFANTFYGWSAGGTTTGNNNTSIGISSGENIGNGQGNVYLGSACGNLNDGNANVFLGTNSGMEAIGSTNIFIGTNTGNTYVGNDKLMIDNVGYAVTPNVAPLIWGDFANDQLKFHGKVGIGGNGATDFGSFPTMGGGGSVANYKLFVKGGILTEELRVALVSTWADYVFNKDYDLKPLSEVEKFISENGHLPNVPSAKQIKEEGVELGNMSRIQQEKIEELTLYLIQQNKDIETLKAQVKALSEKK